MADEQQGARVEGGHVKVRRDRKTGEKSVAGMSLPREPDRTGEEDVAPPAAVRAIYRAVLDAAEPVELERLGLQEKRLEQIRDTSSGAMRDLATIMLASLDRDRRLLRLVRLQLGGEA